MKFFFARYADTPLVVKRLGYHQFEIINGEADLDDNNEALHAAAREAGGKPATKEAPKKAKEVDDAG